MFSFGSVNFVADSLWNEYECTMDQEL